MALSRKDFVKAADILNKVEDKDLREKLSNDFCNWFGEENPFFDCVRFKTAVEK